MYLITASLLNSWNYFLIRGNAKDFERVLSRQPTPSNQYIKSGFSFEKWCEENLEETKGGVYQVSLSKPLENYLLYGRLDCLKAGVVYDYKYSSTYEYGKFINNYQTAMYLELVPEAFKMVYIVTDKKENFNKENIYYEQYSREDTEPILNTIETFMQWMQNNGYIDYMDKYWIAKEGA